MLRTSAGVSLCVLLFIQGMACSSKSTDEGTGGKGSIVTGGTSGSGGNTGRAGSTGDPETDCANEPIICIDAKTASTCNPNTLQTETISCTEDAKDIGIISNGCDGDATDGSCTIDGYADEPCEKGVAPFAVCGMYDKSDALDIYVACFKNTNGLHDVIPCFANYVDEAQKLVDCQGAVAGCLPDVVAGGAGPGAGGTPGEPDPSGTGGTGGTGGIGSPGGTGGTQ